MGEVGDLIAVHLEVDRDGRAAQLGMGGGGGVGVGEPPEPGNVPGQLENSAVVDVVEHGSEVAVAGAAGLDCYLRPNEYIGLAGAAQKQAPWSWSEALRGRRSHVKWECGVRTMRLAQRPRRARPMRPPR